MNRLLEGLNPPQIESVTSSANKILCLAGAGTGKTRALTHRIAYLSEEKRVSCSNMLALTFTRLAGKEMKDRIKALIGNDARDLFCNTFHAWCVNVLMSHAELVGRSKDFTIFDEDDKKDVLNAIISDLKLDVKVGPFMAAMKPKARNLAEQDLWDKVDKEYEYRLKKYNAFDFDSLISSVIKILKKNKSVLNELSERYDYIFVDEFQDTNDEQWELVNLLNPPNLFVVGDDFQSIYGWRGGNIDIIMGLEKNPLWSVIKLEDNYRSTEEIVSAANTLIKHNTQTEKKLIAHKKGPEIEIVSHTTQETEADYIAFKIATMCNDDMFNNFAVLARTNSLVTEIKSKLDTFGVPAEVINKQMDIFKVYDVAMVFKFIKFAFNREDDVTFRRIINYPKKIVDRDMMHKIEHEATVNTECLYHAFMDVCPLQYRDMNNLLEEIYQLDSDDVMDHFLNAINLLGVKDEYIAQTRTTKATLFDVATVSLARWKTYQNEIDGTTPIHNFLHWLSIRDSLDMLMDNRNMVKVMTVHASKGLEFDNVFVAGLNEGTFPSKLGDTQEERRLMYVAMTRARTNLYITFSDTVEDWSGKPKPATVSRFIGDMGR